MSADRYAGLDAHADTGLGAEEPGMRRYTRPSERIPTRCAEPDHCLSGPDAIRTGALANLERRIEHNWRVWEGLTDGQSRTNLARFIHDLEDRADALTEELRATQPGQEKAPGPVAAGSEGAVPNTHQ